MQKQELRNNIRDKKRQFTKQQLGELSLPILKRIDANEHVRQAHTLLLYYSLPDEVDTHDYLTHLVAEGKRVLLPVVIDYENMEIREYTGQHDLREGAFHIMEPIGRLVSEEEYGKIETGIIPGMSFDPKGNRLGRGKGYYDRFLTKVPNMYKIGVCFDFQKMPSIPTEANDIPMDEII